MSDHAQLLEVDELARSQQKRSGCLLAALREGECLVAEASGEVRGFVVLYYRFFGFRFIPLVVVLERSRRDGIGLRLLAAAEARCASTKLFTSTNASNAAAHRLLERAGFERSGVIENLDDGDPEVVYLKPVPRHHDRSL